ncbi:MAG: tetratricopeptide repeat protein [candidate division WOR-3 bacterium]
MYPLLIVILALLIVAIYPVIRDFIRQRKITLPSYVEGLQLLLDGKVEDAKIKLKLAVEEDTNNIDAYIRLGQIFLVQNDPNRALRIHENLALRRNLKPQDELKIYRALVDDYLTLGRHVKAIPLLEEIVRQDRSDYHSHERLLNLYIDTGEWDKAEKLLRNLPRTDSERAARLYARFGFCRGKENPKAGMSYLHEALKLSPKSIPAHIYLGDLLLAQGDINSAINIWNKLLDFAPEKNHLVRERLERAYYESGRYEEIIALYRKLLHRVPHDTSLALNVAKIYAKKEEIENAIDILNNHSKKGETQILAALAAFYLRKGNTEQAQKYLEQIINASSDINSCTQCGRILEDHEIYCAHCQSWLKTIS